jgi:L-ascorbate metabolism protein UlaG (beta-lactamase superfamily)
MQITHFGHACVLVDTGTDRILLDPGIFSPGFETLTWLSAVLVTHDHVDHFDADRLAALRSANPGMPVYGPSGLPVVPGDRLDIGGSRVDVVGGSHAVIHADIPVVPNVGYLVDDGAFFHPGDSFFVPSRRVDVLALPTSGPWLKLGEAVDYLRAVAPRTAGPIHEGALANPAFAFDVIRGLTPTGVTFEEFPRFAASGV